MSLKRKERTGLPDEAAPGEPGKDSRVRTGHLGPDNWDRTAEKSLTGQVSLVGNLDRRERRQESQDMTMFGKSKQSKSNLKNNQADIRNMDIGLYVFLYY